MKRLLFLLFFLAFLLPHELRAEIIRDDCDQIPLAQRVTNGTLCLQQTTVGGRTAGELYVWDGALWDHKAGSVGSATILNLGNDGVNESAGLGTIATTGDTNSVFTEPVADKLLIDLTKRWPVSDTANALTANGTNCGAGEAAAGVDASGNAEGCFLPAGGGGAPALDLGNDAANESAALALIATTGDTNSIFGEPLADKLLIDLTKKWPGANTADALAADPANCAAGTFPLGVAASGAVQNCTALPTTIAGTANQIGASAATGAVTLSIQNNPTLPGTTTGTFSGNLTGNVTGNVAGVVTGSLVGNASTASSLAANGVNCGAGNAPLGVDAAGAVEGCFDVATQTELNTHGALTGTTAHGGTTTNTASQIVVRDGSGNIAVTTMTGNVTGNVTGNLTGNASTASAVAATGVTYTPTGNLTATDAQGAIDELEANKIYVTTIAGAPGSTDCLGINHFIVDTTTPELHFCPDGLNSQPIKTHAKSVGVTQVNGDVGSIVTAAGGTTLSALGGAGLTNTCGTTTCTMTVDSGGISTAMVAAALKTKSISFLVGDRLHGAALADTDDYPSRWRNNIAAMHITEVICTSDAGTPSINLQRNDGSAANILSASLTCTTSGATSTSFTSGEDAIAVGHYIDYLTVTAGGTAKEVLVSIKATLD